MYDICLPSCLRQAFFCLMGCGVYKQATIGRLLGRRIPPVAVGDIPPLTRGAWLVRQILTPHPNEVDVV